ncbi:MAG: hydroxymethylglutaryl-CoA reductase [Bacteroidota bacterium]|nr:hydroxymethylglutaryl-CoA reductase [Bacteroidota bacterium]
MSTSSEKARKLIELFTRIKPFEQVLEDLKLRESSGISPSIPGPISWSKEAWEHRLDFIKKEKNMELPFLTGVSKFEDTESLRGNIENYIGMTQIPTGIMGPLHISGTLAQGDFYVPMATSEGALVASYNRGAKASRLCGGITSVCLTEAVQRAPVFRFNSLSELGTFMFWVLDKIEVFREIVSKHSNHAKLEDFRLNMEGNQAVMIFDYTTGDAAGQNMVTICTDAVCHYIIEHLPIKPKQWYIESNYAGDKKATAVSFSSVRGKKVTAEAQITRQVVKEVLGSTPEDIAIYWQTSSVASVLSGSIGIQGHFANGLTAIFMACGQDVACVSEAFVGVTRMEVVGNGDLYLAVTLPSLMVGTVGGGTGLPTQRECLNLLDCVGPGSARKFAEICGATVLCGELSIAAAMASGNFSKAHKIFGRKK